MAPAWGVAMKDSAGGIDAMVNPKASFGTIGSYIVVLDGSEKPQVNVDAYKATTKNVANGMIKKGIVTNNVFGGAKLGGALAPVGTVIDYSFSSDKDIFSGDFLIDAGVDAAKGFASGAVGGGATTAAIGVAAAEGVVISAPVVGATAIGFGVSWIFVEEVFDNYGGDLVRDKLKNW